MAGVVWEEKCWGKTASIDEPDVIASVLQVDAGWRCSRHIHQHRWNYFRVISGMVDIVMFFPILPGLPKEFRESGRVRLYAGESYDVRPEILHCFEVYKSGTLVELYWTLDGTPTLLDDIIRFDEGGPIENWEAEL